MTIDGGGGGIIVAGTPQVTATAVGAGAVTTASIAANAVSVVSQAKLTAAFSTSSTTFVDVTGLTLTKTAGTGESWLIQASLTSKTSGAASEFQILDGATVLFMGGSNDGTDTMHTGLVSEAPSAASHTVKVQALIGAGTLVIAPADINGTDQTNATLTIVQLKV